MAHAGVTSRPPRAQLDSAGQLKRPLGNVAPSPEGQPVTALARTLVYSHEGVQAAFVDELESGQIDDQAHRANRLCIELAVEQRGGGSIKRAAQPDDQRVWAPLPANDELRWSAPSRRGAVYRTAVSRYALVLQVHAAPGVGPIYETVTGGWSDSNSVSSMVSSDVAARPDADQGRLLLRSAIWQGHSEPWSTQTPPIDGPNLCNLRLTEKLPWRWLDCCVKRIAEEFSVRN